MVNAIEVIDVGPSEIKIPDSDFSHFIAYRRLKGYAPVELSLDHVLELRSQGLIKSIADLQRRKKLSQEEWDKFVRDAQTASGTGRARKTAQWKDLLKQHRCGPGF